MTAGPASAAPIVSDLLRRYFGVETGPVTDPPDDEDCELLIDLGLGGIALSAYGEALEAVDAEAHAQLRAADLTIRVIYGRLHDATLALTAHLQALGHTPVLLKGISIASRYYAEPHHRVMGDIDVLVLQDAEAIVDELLSGHGYEIVEADEDSEVTEDHHHLPPLRAADGSAIIEVHTGLFPPGTIAARQTTFARPAMVSRVRESELDGQKVMRFGTEFELLYVIAHWSADSKWSVNVLSLVDVVSILRAEAATMDWGFVLEELRANPWLAISTSLLFAYLEEEGLVDLPQEVSNFASKTRDDFGGTNTRLAAWLLRRFPIGMEDRAAGFLNSTWSAQVFWENLLSPTPRFARIPKAVLGTCFSRRNRYNPFRILRRTVDLVRR